MAPKKTNSHQRAIARHMRVAWECGHRMAIADEATPGPAPDHRATVPADLNEAERISWGFLSPGAWWMEWHAGYRAGIIDADDRLPWAQR